MPMPLYIRDQAVSDLVAKAQTALGARTKTDAVRIALERAIAAADAGKDANARLARARALAGRFRQTPPYDHKADMDAGWGE